MSEKMKISAVVLSFYYTDEMLYKNVANYINDVDLLIIWDNTPKEDSLITQAYWEQFNTPVFILSNGKNAGIGVALNEAIKYSIGYGCTHIMTMDQDSVWKDFNKYKFAIYSNNIENVALYAPTIANIEETVYYTCNKEDLYAITSGSVISIKFLQYIGLFNEQFFIDEVDNEFCVRVVKKGYHIHIFKDIFLYQQFGPEKSLIGISKYKLNYSAFRTYYQVRNRLWMHRMYPHDLNWRYKTRTYLYSIIRRSILILLFEKNKLNKIRAIVRGMYDGFFSKL